ncbi:hypothetical protein [Bacillus nitroreducens]
MLTLNFDDEMIDILAEKIAGRAYEMFKDKIDSSSNLPHLLTRAEAMKVLRCGDTKMAELMARPDFPVNRDMGVKIPTQLLFKWIEQNTRWVENNTDYFNKKAI